jgi:hypothetical protein
MPISDILRGFRAFWRAWAWFWFRPVSARGVGVMRILMGMMLIMTTLDLFPMLELIVGPEGITDPRLAKKAMSLGRWTWFDSVDSMGAVYAIHTLTLVVNILFMLGFRSQAMGLLSVAAHAALYQRNSWFMNGGDRLVREFALYISLVPCGAAYSIDAWLLRRKAAKAGCSTAYSALVPIFSHRLIQLQLCFVYLTSGLDKVATKSWSGGTALFYSLSSENYQRSEALVEPLLTTKLGQQMCEMGTYISVYWEIGFIFMVLWRPTRILALWLGLAIHGGIHVLLMVAYFSAVSVWGYLSFVRYHWVEDLDRWWARCRARPSVAQRAEE